MAQDIINKVANSSLVQIDLEEYLPTGVILEIDLATTLHEGLILREKDIRGFIKSTDWSTFSNATVAVHCSQDAIVPNWAYMLIASALSDQNARALYGTMNEVKETLLIENFANSQLDKYVDKKILVKGFCSFELTPKAFVVVTTLLQKNASSLMFGEACSSVPVFKKRKQ